MRSSKDGAISQWAVNRRVTPGSTPAGQWGVNSRVTPNQARANSPTAKVIPQEKKVPAKHGVASKNKKAKEEEEEEEKKELIFAEAYEEVFEFEMGYSFIVPAPKFGSIIVIDVKKKLNFITGIVRLVTALTARDDTKYRGAIIDALKVQLYHQDKRPNYWNFFILGFGIVAMLSTIFHYLFRECYDIARV